MRALISFIVGLIFSVGLVFGGMTQVHVVRGFLDFFGQWNLALMGVMIGAIGVHSVLYFLIRKRKTPMLDTHFHVPTRKDVDPRLLAGAALFGLGWGWAGICPGPGIVAAASGQTPFLIFIAAMIAGMGLFKLIEKKLG
jgi:uncharacterized membrane protein YedE/YeeE